MRTVRRARSQTRTARSRGDVVSIKRLNSNTRGSRAVANAHGITVRDGSPWRNVGDHRSAQDGAPRRLAVSEVILDDQVLGRIDEIVPPGTDVALLDASYNPPAIMQANLRCRPTAERTASFMPLNPSIAVALHERLASGELLLLQLACGL